MVTFRRSGEAVPTPVWAGLADGRLYFRSEKRVGKIKRIRANPRVLVAPCDSRGKPLGEAVEGRARILPPSEEPTAEAAIQSNFGLGRRMYEGVAMNLGPEGVYVEVTPTAATAGGHGMSRFEDPVIISCSISGAVANRDQCPAIPYTPEEYAAEARRIVDEGGSQIHIHARTPEGVPSYEIEDFRAITEAILAEVGDVIVNYSTGAIGVPIDKRIEYLRELRPDVAALNMSSMNYAKYSQRRKDFVFKAVFENSFDTIIEFLTAMREIGIRPEHECFDAGHIANLDPLLDMGLLEPPLQVSLRDGRQRRHPARRRATSASCRTRSRAAPRAPNHWQVIGISRDQWKLIAAALSLGGNVRAGLEDNFYLPNGEMARSNGDLIAKARQMAEDMGRRAATVAEAREMLGLPKRVEA